MKVVDLKKLNFQKYISRKPYKDFNYFKKRFFNHPIYKYNIYGIFKKSNLLSILVTRVIKHKNSTCLRIVDFYGDESTLNIYSSNLKEIMYKNKHEYIDFFSKGLKKKIILNAGFKVLDVKNKNTVIPNYFEPFIQTNQKIRFFFDKGILKNLRIFKGDGDQDRPSMI